MHYVVLESALAQRAKTIVKKLGISSTRLMDESEFYIRALRHRPDLDGADLCEALFDSPKTYCRWESGHFQLMKSVASDLRADSQTMRLRRTCFSLSHQKALFEYLRNYKVVGKERVAVITALYGAVDYNNAVIAEHGRFQRSSWSLLCADHLVEALLNDALFERELGAYQALYADYFALYCGNVIASSRGEDYALQPLIGQLKRAAARKRDWMMALPLHRRRSPVKRGRARATSGPHHRPRPRYSW